MLSPKVLGRGVGLDPYRARQVMFVGRMTNLCQSIERREEVTQRCNGGGVCMASSQANGNHKR